MPETTATQRQRLEDLRLMLQEPGWQHVLVLILQHLRQSEAALAPGNSEAYRLDAIGRRGMLLDLLQMVYRSAEMPSPMETHYFNFLGVVSAPEAAPQARSHPPVQASPAPTPRPVRRQAGSVA